MRAAAMDVVGIIRLQITRRLNDIHDMILQRAKQTENCADNVRE